MIKRLGIVATKAELKAEQNKIMRLQAFDSRYFRVKSHSENYSVLQLVLKYFKKKGNHILAWKPKLLSNESVTPHAASNISLGPSLNLFKTKLRLKFDESCLKKEKVNFLMRK